MPDFYNTIMVTVCIFISASLCLLLFQGTTVVEGRSERISTDPSQSIKNLCPHLRSVDDVSPYRYSEQDRRCHIIKSKGPCGENMLFYEKDEVKGFCDCDSSSDRILIYHASTKQCYFIFQKGYCKQREWLDITREGKPICTPNPCFKTKQTNELVLFRGNCTELSKNHPSCEPSEKVDFVAKSRLPKCIPAFGLFSIGVPPSSCPVGSVNALGGLCQPPFDFD